MELVTGHKGSVHVTSDQQGAFNTMIFGDGKYVLDVGSKFAYEIISNNQVNIKDGQLINQGRQFSTDFGDVDEVSIDNGAQGVKRIDLICAVYEKDITTGIETGSLRVVKGTPSETEPAVPSYTTGNILEGAVLDYMPLYKVNIDGLTITSVEAVYEMQSNFKAESEAAITEFEERTEVVIEEAAKAVEEAISNLYPILLWQNQNDTIDARTVVTIDNLSEYKIIGIAIRKDSKLTDEMKPSPEKLLLIDVASWEIGTSEWHREIGNIRRGAGSSIATYIELYLSEREISRKSTDEIFFGVSKMFGMHISADGCSASLHDERFELNEILVPMKIYGWK